MTKVELEKRINDLLNDYQELSTAMREAGAEYGDHGWTADEIVGRILWDLKKLKNEME